MIIYNEEVAKCPACRKEGLKIIGDGKIQKLHLWCENCRKWWILVPGDKIK